MAGLRLFSAIVSLLGFLAMAVGVGAVVCGLNSAPMMIKEPGEAMDCAQNFLEAINKGSLTEVSAYLFGHPDPSKISSDADSIVCLIWDTYRTRLEARAVGGLYASEEGLALDMELTVPDADAAVRAIGELAVARIKQRAAQASDMSELYGEDGQYRTELVNEVLQQAALEILMEELPTKTSDITLHLTKSDGVWLVMPEQSLMHALSGKAV